MMTSSPPATIAKLSSPSTVEVPWTRASLTTLLHGLLLSNASISDAATLLPTYSPSQIATTLRNISTAHHNPTTWTDAQHARAVLHLATGHTTSPPPPPQKPPPRHRVRVQVVPARLADDAAVRVKATNPNVEVVLRARRRCWDVVRHLYSKWGIPVILLAKRRQINPDLPVAGLVADGRIGRVAFRVASVIIDWRVMEYALSQGVPHVAGRSRRAFANRPIVPEEGLVEVRSVVARRRAPSEEKYVGIPDTVKSDCENVEDVNAVVLKHDTDQHGSSQQETGESEADRLGKKDVAPELEHDARKGEAVMKRLRSHLEKLDQQTMPASCSSLHSLDAIPENFLKSGSAFEMPVVAQLPRSMLSLGESLASVGLRGPSDVALDLSCREGLTFAGVPHTLDTPRSPELSFSGMLRRFGER